MELTPRDGAKIPKAETLTPDQKALHDEMEAMVKDERHALAVLAKAAAQTAESNEEVVALMQELKDILVKVCEHFKVPLPGAIQRAIEAKEYNPDEDPGDDEEDDEDAEGDPA